MFRWFIFLILVPWVCAAESIQGQASVTDGDTLEIHGQRIRLLGIDAPESPQYCDLPGQKKWRCGQAAAMALDDFIGDKTVTCAQKGKDRYRRSVAVCSGLIGPLKVNASSSPTPTVPERTIG